VDEQFVRVIVKYLTERVKDKLRVEPCHGLKWINFLDFFVVL
jgi:hypothetical protein